MKAGQRVEALASALREAYPDAGCSLKHENAFQLLVATVLSAQCTDERVNQVTPALFARCPSPKELAAVDSAELEGLIRSTGFYRNKAKNLKGAAKILVERFGGAVPGTMAELVSLPGVARKTANVVLGNAFGLSEGFVVDTHVSRLGKRMGLTVHDDPAKIEVDLMKAFSRDDWTAMSHRLIHHGRAVCQARKPACASCPVEGLCPKIGVGA